MKVPISHIASILAGGITQLRRPYHEGQDPPHGAHPIHRPGGKPVCTIEILTATLEPLDTVTDDQAKAEGYDNADHYRDEWSRLHRVAWTGEHAWLVTFQVRPPRETTSFLLPGAKAGDKRGTGYETSPLRRLPYTPDHPDPPEVVERIREATDFRDEPEAVDPEQVRNLPASLEARQRHHLLKVSEIAYLEQLPLAERIARIKQLADENHIDVSGPLKEVERQVRRAINRLGKAA